MVIRKKILVFVLAIAITFTMGFDTTLCAYAISDVDGDESVDATEKSIKTEGQLSEDEVLPTDAEVTATEEVKSEGKTEKIVEPSEEKSVDADKSGNAYYAYNALWIQKYADSRYVDVSTIDMKDFLSPATVARGVATYNIDKQKDFDVTATNYIASVTYDVPVYDVDKNSNYYVAIPNVNLGDKRFGAYDFMLTYNNEQAEFVDGYYYDSNTSIAYIPKNAVIHPDNDNALVEGKDCPLAMQLNYYFKNDIETEGKDAVFEKNIPISLLQKDNQTYMQVSNADIFETYISVKTGIKNAEGVNVFLNGTMFPIKEDAFLYNTDTGEVVIQASPAVVSNVNIVFDMPSGAEKIAEKFVDKAFASFQSDKKVSKADMKLFKTKKNKVIVLKAKRKDEKRIEDVLYVGWRGNYKSAKLVHTNDKAKLIGLKGWKNSLRFMYGGYMKGYSIIPKETKKRLDTLWAISSYNLGTDIVNNNALTKGEKIKKSNDPGSEKKNIYAWMVKYNDILEKSSTNAIGDTGNESGGAYGGYNGLGGRNNFGFRFPMSINGSKKSLVPSGHTGYSADNKNPDINFKTGGDINSSYYLAASCSHLGEEVNASDVDNDRQIYVTCIGLKKPTVTKYGYIVFAFTSANASYSQSANAIYKFRLAKKIEEKHPKLKVQKTSSNKDITDGNRCYDLTGAKYAVYESLYDAEHAIIRDASGKIISGDTSVEDGDDVPDDDSDTEEEADDSDETDEEATTDEDSDGDEDPEGDDDTSGDSSSDEEYNEKEYNEGDDSEIADSDDGRIEELVLDAKGESPEVELDIDKDTTVYVREVEAPKGYSLSPEIKAVDLKLNQTATAKVDFTNEPQGDPITVFAIKTDGELNPNGLSSSEVENNFPTDDAHALSGAIFVVKYYDKKIESEEELKGMTPLRIWRFETDERGRINLQASVPLSGSDELYVDSAGTKIIPVGTVTVEEETPPQGYRKSNKISIGIVSEERNGEAKVYTYKHIRQTTEDDSDVAWIGDIPYRGDVEFVKVLKKSDGNTEPMKNIPFLITRTNTGESHVVVTDANGKFNSSTLNNQENTNKNDEILNEDGTVNEEKFKENIDARSGYGVFFSESSSGKTAEFVSEGGSFLMGDYSIKELRCEANSKMKLVKPMNFTVTEEMAKAKTPVNLGTLENIKILIHTMAKDSKLDNHITYAGPGRKIVDTVYYEGLNEGEEYTLKGWAVDSETGEKITQIPEQESTFTPKTVNGEHPMEFTVDASQLEGKTIVFYEELYEKGGKEPLVEHKDNKDEKQSIHIPKVRTTALGEDTKMHIVTTGEDSECKITDSVQYWNLIPGVEYTLHGALMDKETGKQVNMEGAEVTETFTPETADGVYDMHFNIEGRPLAGHTMVVFETLYLGNETEENMVASHKDINDVDQSIEMPRIGTTAKGKDTRLHITTSTKNTTIVDTVKYEHLIPGTEYTVFGTLMDKQTEEPFVDENGEEITSSQTFTPEKSDGYVEVEFDIDPRKAANTAVVVFEELYLGSDTDGAFITDHKDIEDEEQTVYIPKIGTKAKLNKSKIKDTVDYHNLLPGEKYRMVGTLMDKKTGNPVTINGKKVTASKTFKPSSSDGSIVITFSITPEKVRGKTLVAFEKCYVVADTDVEIAKHENINDKAQTVKIPKVPPKKPPKTGDTVPWVLMIIALLGISLSAITIRRKIRP